MQRVGIAFVAVFISNPPVGWGQVLLQVGTHAQQVRDPPEGWVEVLVPFGHDEVLGKPGQSHSQVGQDMFVQSLLKCKRGGFFLDLAANDAVKLSNTLMLERDFGWNGICIEANPFYMPGLAKRRCTTVLTAVASPSNQLVNFTFRGVLGGIVSGKTDNKEAGYGDLVTLRTKALGEILDQLDAPRTIDYFSLDVEGAESLVMNGFPWDKYQFNVITVERPKEDLRIALLKHGYHFLKATGFDDETWAKEDVAAQDMVVPATSAEFAELCHHNLKV